MKNCTKLLSALLLLAVFFDAGAQDRDRFNIGVHYKPPVANEIEDLALGMDLRVRAVSFAFVNVGAGLSATYRKDNNEALSDFVIWNPQAYVEFQPFSFPLKPYVAVGYAFYSQEIDIVEQLYFDYDSAFASGDQKLNYDGISGHVGLRFDFVKILYADLGLGYYNFTSSSARFSAAGNNGYAMIHLGAGFRF